MNILQNHILIFSLLYTYQLRTSSVGASILFIKLDVDPLSHQSCRKKF